MAMYSVIRAGVALSTTNDHITYVGNSNRGIKMIRAMIGGEATASAVNRPVLQYSTSGTTGGGAITPEKFNSKSPAAGSGTWYTTWSSQPTLSGNPVITLPFNAFGGVINWVASPGEEIWRLDTEQFSIFRTGTGTSTISSTIVFEEV